MLSSIADVGPSIPACQDVRLVKAYFLRLIPMAIANFGRGVKLVLRWPYRGAIFVFLLGPVRLFSHMSRLPERHALLVIHITMAGDVRAFLQLFIVLVAEGDMKALWVLLTNAIDRSRGMQIRSCSRSASRLSAFCPSCLL